MPDTYRGSLKHKSRPARGRKGTICPEWTHATPSGGLGTDPQTFDWAASPAAELFSTASVDPGDGRRFATRRGIAFEAKPTADGTWHGSPVPWEGIPAHIKDRWLDEDAVTRQDVRRYLSRAVTDIRWALETDDG